MKKIMIVEDDATIADVVANELKLWGYTTFTTQDFTSIISDFNEFEPHLVLLDLSLPFRSGFHWCSEIRKTSSVPIIFISSAANNINMLTALHQGADDFIAKPFDIQLLIAKTQALLRRSYQFTEHAKAQIFFGNTTLNLADMNLEFSGNIIELTKNEFRILQLLFEGNGGVVSRENIMRLLWSDEHFIDENTLTVNINRLRKKLSMAGLDNFIITKKGEGYFANENP